MQLDLQQIVMTEIFGCINSQESKQNNKSVDPYSLIFFAFSFFIIFVYNTGADSMEGPIEPRPSFSSGILEIFCEKKSQKMSFGCLFPAPFFPNKHPPV